MKFFLLGGTSYLGQEIIRSLTTSGLNEISVFIRHEASVSKMRPYQVNLIDDKSISHLAPQDVVLNLVVDYGKGKTREEIQSINVDFPLSILKKIQFKTILNFSTGLGKDVSDYAFTKRMLEEKLSELAKLREFQLLNLRLQHFFGPRAPSHNFVTFLVTKLLANEDISLTDCQQKRDFISTTDVVSAIGFISSHLDRFKNDDIVEIGSGRSIILQDFIERIKVLANSKSHLKYGEVSRRPNEPDEVVASVEYLKELGWEPKISLENGIRETVDWFSHIK
jgi:CDP-paratose synthetase